MCVGSPTAGTLSSSQQRPDDEFETDRLSPERYRAAVVIVPLTGATNARNFDSSHVATCRHFFTSVQAHVEHASSSSPKGTGEKQPSTRNFAASHKARDDLRPLEATARSDRRSSH